LKDIHGVANIIEEDVIELLVPTENFPELIFVRERDYKIEGWIALLRDFDYLGANVDTFALAWPNSG
jgi:hypothetical protein